MGKTVVPQLTNEDVLFLIKMIDAAMNDAYLVPGRGDTRERFRQYQNQLLLKLRALDLDKVYEGLEARRYP